MRKQPTPVEEASADSKCCSTIPISHLGLDLSAPMVGWKAMLASRGVEIVLDDVGRPAVPRAVLGELIAERDAREAKRVEEAQRELEEAKRNPRPARPGIPLPKGADINTPAYAVLVGYDPE